MLKTFVRQNERRDKDGKRISRGKKIGVLVATVNEDGKIVVGHSKWNRSIDDYNPAEGERIAMRRVETDSKVPPALSIFKHYNDFVKRALKYFKQADGLSTNTKIAKARGLNRYNKAARLMKEAKAADVFGVQAVG